MDDIPKALQTIHDKHIQFMQSQNDWISERDDLLQRIAFLEGERTGWEMSRAALTKRVKMLEYALQQARGQSGHPSVDVQQQQDTDHELQAILKASKEQQEKSAAIKEKLKRYLKEAGIQETSQPDTTTLIIPQQLQQETDAQRFSSWKAKKKSKSPFNTVTTVQQQQSADLSAMGLDEVVEEKKVVAEENKSQWKPKFTLRSHFDSVRAVQWCNSSLLTASEDGTIKLWNVSTTNKKVVEIDPSYTFRKHLGSVMCMDYSSYAMEASVESSRGVFASGGYDGKVNVWALPPDTISQYGVYTQQLIKSFDICDDIVWDVKFHTVKNMFLALSSSGLYYHQLESDSKDYLELERPSSIEVLKKHPHKILVGFQDGSLSLYDIETKKEIQKFKPENSTGQINKVKSHPTHSQCLVATEDRTVRFHDINDLSLSSDMVAHLDAVSSLDVTQDNFVTTGHDASVRIWNWTSRQCVQEFSAHRKKYDESIFAVQFGPSLLATGGADSCAKVYTT